MTAFKAFNADIGPQPYHLPLVAAAGMNLLESDHVTELDFKYHIYIVITKQDWAASG
jgi:hypothetical protein